MAFPLFFCEVSVSGSQGPQLFRMPSRSCSFLLSRRMSHFFLCSASFSSNLFLFFLSIYSIQCLSLLLSLYEIFFRIPFYFLFNSIFIAFLFSSHSIEQLHQLPMLASCGRFSQDRVMVAAVQYNTVLSMIPNSIPQGLS